MEKRLKTNTLKLANSQIEKDQIHIHGYATSMDVTTLFCKATPSEMLN